MKTVDVSTTTAPTSVNYDVVVSDPDSAGPAYNATLTDTLTDPTGATMYTRSWELDTINPGDQIDLTYSVAYGTSTKPGLYHNVATVTGQESYSGNMTQTLASGSGSVYFLPNGLVLGDSTSSISIATSTIATMNASSTDAICLPLISSYLKPGAHVPDVVKLQTFLDEIGSSVPTTGYFGPITTAAVKTFQAAFADDILAPVGLTKPTGLVYASTLHEINQLACGTVPVTGNVTAPAPVAAALISNTPNTPPSGKKPSTAVKVKPPVEAPASLPAPAVLPVAPSANTGGFFGTLFKHLF